MARQSRYFKGQTSDQPGYGGEGPRPMGTKPLLPVRVPDIDPDHVIEALRGTGGDYSSENIRSSIRRMVDAGTVSPKQAGHLAMLAVYAGDRIEGINTGEAVLGGVKPGDERNFQGSPSELAAMRRKKSGTRREIAESVPAEYKPILSRVFSSESGRKLLADALRTRFKKGKVPTGTRTEERIEGAVRNIGFARPKTSLAPEPGEKPVGPTLSRDRERNINRAESGAMTRTDLEPAPTRIRRGSPLESLGALASGRLRPMRKKPGSQKKVKNSKKWLGEIFRGATGNRAAARQDIEEKEQVEFPYRSRGTPPARKLSGGRPGFLPRVSATPGKSDIAPPRPVRPTRSPRGQSLEGRVPASVIRPTREGVLSKIAERAAQQEQEPVKQESKMLRAIDRLRRIRVASGRAAPEPLGPPVPVQAERYAGPGGPVTGARSAIRAGGVGKVSKIPYGSRVVMRKARRKPL